MTSPKTPAVKKPHPWHRLNDWTKAFIIVAGGFATLGIFVLGGVLADNNENDDEPAKTFTAVEAACQMLNDGETVRFTYDVMVDLMRPDYTGDGHKAAAQAVVAEAQAQGCGN